MITPGDEWGTPSPRPVGSPLLRSDREVMRAVLAGREPVVRGGDLHRAIGAPLDDAEPRRLPVDVIRIVDADTNQTIGHAIAHVIVRKHIPLGPLLGEVVVVANVEHIRGRQWLPRAHPNDGALDRLDVGPSMSVRQRIEAARRARRGDHLPHPGLRAARGQQFEVVTPPGSLVLVDGTAISTPTRISIEVIPDAGWVRT